MDKHCKAVSQEMTFLKKRVAALEAREAQLQQGYEYLQQLFELAPLSYQSLDSNGCLLEVNQAWLNTLGYAKEEVVGRNFSEFLHPDWQNHFKENFPQLKTIGEILGVEFELVRKDGSTLTISLDGNISKTADGQFQQTHCIFHDITERKRFEEALQRSEQKARDAKKFLELILDTIPVRLFWKDLDLRYLGCNQLFAQDAGINNPKELLGTDDYALAWQEQAEQYRKDDLEVITSGTPKLTFEELQTTPDGRQITLLTSKVPIRNESNEIIGLLGTYEDITERKRMENEVIRTQKLELLGRLAGEIAHNFNNLLMSIMGNISFAKMDVSPSEKVYERLTFAETACVKANELSQQFLIFSKGGAPVRRSTTTANLIKTNSQLALSGAKSTCKLTIPDDLWNSFVDADQIGQVLTNLLINADQAMPNGGVINLNCENVTIGKCSGLPLKTGDYIKVSIKDQGTGVKKKDIDHIFEPYFSTKSSGTGLGLASAYSIIKKHEGYIGVESTSESGTVISFFIPRAHSSLIAIEQEEKIAQGKGRLLIMDDDKMVLNTIGTMLEYLGYTFEAAEDGEKALALYENAILAGQPFDLVLMDLVVPQGMGGKEATQKLLLLDSHAKVVVSSGYSDDPVIANYESYGFCGKLQKPYRLKELSLELEKLLNS